MNLTEEQKEMIREETRLRRDQLARDQEKICGVERWIWKDCSKCCLKCSCFISFWFLHSFLILTVLKMIIRDEIDKDV